MTNVPTGAVISLALIRSVVGKMTKAQVANANSVVVALQTYGDAFGLDQPHRLAQMLAQDTHESGAFAFDREVWGPTKAQKGYEGRKDLGNTQPGDGRRFSGRTGIQITGRANTRSFRDWCRKLMAGTSVSVPDFEKNPDAMLTDPWEGLGPIWYWDTRGLNRYADQGGDIEMITRKVNGGTNGLDDRIKWYARYALVMLGFGPNDLVAFQKRAGVKVDNVPGPRTRAALHRALVALTAPVLQAPEVQAAPVVEAKTVQVPVPVKAKDLEKPWYKDLMGQKEMVGVVAPPAFSFLSGAPWQTVAIVAGVCLILAGAFYVIRRRDAAKQEAQVQAIHADAAEAKAAL